MKQILVYVDEGAEPHSVRLLLKTLRATPHPITRVNRTVIASESWEDDAALLIFPGGRDVYYHRALSGAPNGRIRSYIDHGGRYLGICAGGYYGCDRIEFEKGYPLEVIGNRELKFFPGLAKGPAYGPGQFRYEDESGSRIAHLTLAGGQAATVYFNGGCEFVDADYYVNTAILARYSDLPHTPAAIIQCQVGKGKAILSGVHPEYNSGNGLFKLLLSRLLEEDHEHIPGKSH